MEQVEKNKKFKIFIQLIVIVVFIILSVFVALHHEHWSDEAQAFLIARDSNFLGIINCCRYEGAPPLWSLIIKVFILLGGTYNTFFILPIIFSVIGMAIFEFKVDAPLYIKILLPFTYFIFYQYTIVERNYCLVFPVMMLIAITYKDRMKKPIIYATEIFLLTSICAYTYAIAASLFLLYLFDFYPERNGFENRKRILTAITLMAIGFATILFMCIPANDAYFPQSSGIGPMQIIFRSTIGIESMTELAFWLISSGVAIFIILCIALEKDNKKHKFIDLFVLTGFLFVVYLKMRCQIWHIGIFTILLITYFSMNDMIKNNIMVKLLLTLICCVQIVWTFSASTYDIQNNFSASKDVANYLTTLDCKNKTIFGCGYSVTAIQPYFDYNIFNKNYDKSYWEWKVPTEDDSVNNDKQNTNKGIRKYDIFIVSDFYKKENMNIVNTVKASNEYTELYFSGHTYAKMAIYESEGYWVYVRRDIE